MLKPLIIGHRGASASAPENTLPAFELALAQGADGLEFDVRLAGDGVPVVIHDHDLRRTGGRPAVVASTPSAELKMYDVGTWFNRVHPTLASAAFESARIPLLSEVFERFSRTTLVLYVELKSEGSSYEQLADAVTTMIERFDLNNRVIVESFDLRSVALIKKLSPALKTAALFEPGLNPRSLSITRIMSMAREVCADEIALHHSLLTASRARRMRDAGFEIATWTVDRRRWARFASMSGVKALITNSPSVMLEAREAVLHPNQ